MINAIESSMIRVSGIFILVMLIGLLYLEYLIDKSINFFAKKGKIKLVYIQEFAKIKVFF